LLVRCVFKTRSKKTVELQTRLGKDKCGGKAG